jgi:molybdopterin biosynthesis enzyme
MDDVRTPLQRIERLTPLAEVLTAIETQVTPIAAREVGLASALGCVLADDIVADRRPQLALALRDGYALRSEETTDAGSYAPAPLSLATRVNVGETVPPGADAITDAVSDDGLTPRALAPVAPGDGVLMPGQDCESGEIMLPAGRALRGLDVAILEALGIGSVSVRSPIALIVQARPDDPILQAVTSLLARSIKQHATATVFSGTTEAAFGHVQEADVIIVLGGSGEGTNDNSVRALAQAGRLVAHGIGLSPGETSAFGFIERTPVLIIPGRLDAALAVWHVLGARMMARLAGRTDAPAVRHAKLARKIASTIGLVEFVPVATDADMVTPLASTYLPWRVLAQATGYVLVPAQQEGFAPGTLVPVNPL